MSDKQPKCPRCGWDHMPSDHPLPGEAQSSFAEPHGSVNDPISQGNAVQGLVEWGHAVERWRNDQGEPQPPTTGVADRKNV